QWTYQTDTRGESIMGTMLDSEAEQDAISLGEAGENISSNGDDTSIQNSQLSKPSEKLNPEAKHRNRYPKASKKAKLSKKSSRSHGQPTGLKQQEIWTLIREGATASASTQR
ncbi:MAG: hypothetical protein Q9212_001902, partial [Teloschistes hypoglaucus]